MSTKQFIQKLESIKTSKISKIQPTQNAVPYTAENWAKFLAIREQLLKKLQPKKVVKVEVIEI